MSRVFRLFVMMLFVAAPVAAQSKPAPAEKTAEQLRAEIATLQAMLADTKTRSEAQPVNVRLELTITDQRGDQPAISKTVSMTFADRHNGRIRTQGDVRAPGGQGFRPVMLNVDGNATIIQGGKARVMLTIEYRPVDRPLAMNAESEGLTMPNINESLTVILEDGKPMVVSQSADPVTDRKVKVEAKIMMLK